jgi:hypothetical protein
MSFSKYSYETYPDMNFWTPSFGGVRVDWSQIRAGAVNESWHLLRGPGSLERAPHNLLHQHIGGYSFRLIGGNMVQPEVGIMADPYNAPTDPIFWLFHANLDRLWQQWEDTKGRSDSHRQDPLWLNERWTFANEWGQNETISVADVVDSSQIGYVYENSGHSNSPRVQLGWTPIFTKAIDVSQRFAVSFNNNPILVNVFRQTDVMLKGPGHDEPYGPRNELGYTLRMDNVVTSRAMYDIFINLPHGIHISPEMDPTRDHEVAPHFVGIFSGSAPEGPFDNMRTLESLRLYDLTENVRQLKNKGLWDSETMIKITFAPKYCIDAHSEVIDLYETQLTTSNRHWLSIGNLTILAESPKHGAPSNHGW